MEGDHSGRPDQLDLAGSAEHGSIEPGWSGTNVDQGAADSDLSASDADQSAADSDQSASDADQTASERDEIDAASDQLAADRDQASADRQRRLDAGGDAREAYEASRAAREVSTISRLFTRVARARTSRSRVETAADRARAAADRERAARDRANAAREHARLEAELNSAHLDDLTGAFRRETGVLALRHEIDRARRAGGRFVIAFVDIDGMKLVNDRDGPAAGDHVLQTLVWTIRANLRSFDPVVRYGGDEFVCGLGGVDIDEVESRFDLIDRTMRGEVGVGISVGLAALAADETLDELTARADLALLDAKRRHGDKGGF